LNSDLKAGAEANGCVPFDTGHARSYSTQGPDLAHRILGRKGFWPALRSNVHPDESGHHLYQWRQVRALEVSLRSDQNRQPIGEWEVCKFSRVYRWLQLEF